MQVRYTGFDQTKNIRTYKFDIAAPGEGSRHLLVTADIGLFLVHRIGIQEGPMLCMQKLANQGEELASLRYELTNDDLLAHVSARLAADARKAATRKPHFGRESTKTAATDPAHDVI